MVGPNKITPCDLSSVRGFFIEGEGAQRCPLGERGKKSVGRENMTCTGVMVHVQGEMPQER